jgi:hypothetical protein
MLYRTCGRSKQNEKLKEHKQRVYFHRQVDEEKRKYIICDITDDKIENHSRMKEFETHLCCNRTEEHQKENLQIQTQLKNPVMSTYVFEKVISPRTRGICFAPIIAPAARAFPGRCAPLHASYIHSLSRLQVCFDLGRYSLCMLTTTISSHNYP